LTRIKACAWRIDSLRIPQEVAKRPLANRNATMHSTPHPIRLPASPETWAQDSAALRARALDLQRARDNGIAQPLLRGKNIGLLCESDADADAAVLRGAAAELGANVASIRPSLSELSTPQDIARTARILGRLYDAVVCHGLSPQLVRQLRDDAGVPVLEGVPCWVDGVDGAQPTIPAAIDSRRFMLQAALLSTLR
jgi:ornithine carbamoyltransferase